MVAANIVRKAFGKIIANINIRIEIAKLIFLGDPIPNDSFGQKFLPFKFWKWIFSKYFCFKHFGHISFVMEFL